MSFEVAIVEIAPQWLLGDTGRALLVTFGRMLDTLLLQLTDGIKARFPTHAPDDALGYIGNDRSLEQGPSEPNDNFRTRLISAVPSNKNRGGGRTLLSQLAGYFDGIAEPPLRLVSNSKVWHTYDWATGTSEKILGDNWDWDGQPTLWWRGWVIIDGATLGWAPWVIGEAGATFDDGHVLGSTATEQEIQTIQRIVQRWKPANVYVTRIIVTFQTGMFEMNMDADTSGKRRGPWDQPKFHFFLDGKSNPDGTYGDPASFDADATYWLGGGEEP